MSRKPSGVSGEAGLCASAEPSPSTAAMTRSDHASERSIKILLENRSNGTHRE
jgi:hypothetical protein